MPYDTGVMQKNPGAPGEVRDVLTDILRHGAPQLLAQAIETEKDPKIGRQCINAKAETVAEKPSFRAAFKARRCLVIALGSTNGRFRERRSSLCGSV